jgi:hypothetical protein
MLTCPGTRHGSKSFDLELLQDSAVGNRYVARG